MVARPGASWLDLEHYQEFAYNLGRCDAFEQLLKEDSGYCFADFREQSD